MLNSKWTGYSRENRLMYTRLLLHMLKRGVLEGPFHQSPEQGELKTLPSYMVCFAVKEHAFYFMVTVLIVHLF
jgi:hypothetical protein